MSDDRVFSVEDPETGVRRAYSTTRVAQMADVTPKTVTTWLLDGRTSTAFPLRGWPPRSDSNQTGRWLVDADHADAAFASSAQPPSDQISALAEERARLAEERSLLDLERQVFDKSRMEQLEEDNARLRDERDRLKAKVTALGSVIRDLTVDVST